MPWSKGKPRTQVTKDKLSNALKGRKFSTEHKRKISEALKGREFTDEAKEKMSVAKKGRPLSPEHRHKIGEANTGKKRSPEYARKLSIVLKGRSFSAEHRANISIAARTRKYTDEGRRKRSIAVQGCSNPNWKGGIAFEPYGPEFNSELKFQIRTRDNFICQKCRKTEGVLYRVLDVHHIDYDKKNNDSNNLITLCNPCNARANGNREYWQPFFEQLIETKLRHEWLRPVHRLETMV